MFAGSDTTAVTLRAIVYYVLKNAHVHRKLQRELDTSNLAVPVSYKAAQSLPYLGAVIEEAIRMHPAVGLPLERIVPASGLTLPDGRFLAPGTIVGMNPWVVHHDKTVFGQDPESFIPERWLQGPDEPAIDFQSRRSRMREAILTFGAGNRVCLGKYLSKLEMYKCIATLFSLYQVREAADSGGGIELTGLQMEFVDPAREWRVQNSWFVRQSGMDVIIKRRN